MVIALHSTGPWLLRDPVGSTNWQIANFINSLCRGCVPFFFMLSGHLVAGRNRPLGIYVQKRVLRILPSFLGATAVALLYRAAAGDVLKPIDLISWLWYPAFYHLDFFYGLGIVYFAFAIWTPATSRPILGATGCLILAVVFGYVLAPKTSGAISHALYYVGYLAFAVGGHFAGRLSVSSSAGRRLGATGVACLVATGALTYLRSRSGAALDQTYYDYCSPLVATGSFLLFISARHLFPSRAPGSFVKLVDRASLPIYCVHPFIIGVIFKTWAIWTISPLIAIPAVVSFSVAIILALVAGI